MGSQAAAFAFATPVGAPSRGATGGRRIARGGALGDGERRVSCAAASGSRAGFPASRGGPSQKDTSTGWARRQDARVAIAAPVLLVVGVRVEVARRLLFG